MQAGLIWVGAGAAALAATALWASRREASVAEILTPNSGYHLIIREEVMAEPLIDLRVFGRHLVWPQRTQSRVHRSTFGVNPGLAAVVECGNPTQVPKWQVDGREVTDPLRDLSRGRIWVPYVYGTKSRDLAVEVGPGALLKVRVPANGRTAPALPSFQLKAGSWDVQINPHPAIFAGANLKFDVKVDTGTTGQPVWFTSQLVQGGTDFSPHPTQPRVECGRQAGILEIGEWPSDGRLRLHLAAGASRSERFTVLRQPLGSGTQIMIMEPDGGAFGAYRFGGTSRGFDLGRSPFGDVIWKGRSLVPAYARRSILRGGSRYLWPSNMDFLLGFNDGEIIDVIAERITERRDVDIDLKLPAQESLR